MSNLWVADERFLELIPADAEFEVIADGFAFTEGPSWNAHEQHLTFTDIPASRIHRWSVADNTISVLREPSNMTNGTCYDRQGRLLMCEHAASRVTRLEPDGSISVIADRWNGRELNSPNDIVVDRDDGIWFTDPLYGRESHTGLERDPELDFCGLFNVTPAGELRLIDDSWHAPNGLCFSPDFSLLYVNDSEEKFVRAYPMIGSEVGDQGDLFTKTEDPDGQRGRGSPDGMKVDMHGNVWVGGPGGIHVYTPGAELLGIVLTPAFPANLCFGGETMKDLFITAESTLLRLRTSVRGQPLFR